MVEQLQRVDTALANIKSIDDFACSTEGLLAFKSEASHNLIKTEPIPKTDWNQSHSELQSLFISGLVGSASSDDQTFGGYFPFTA